MLKLITFKVAAIATMLLFGVSGAAYAATNARTGQGAGGSNPQGDRDGTACGETVTASAGTTSGADFDRDDSSSTGHASDADWQADQSLLAAGVNSANLAHMNKVFGTSRGTQSGPLFAPNWALGHRFAMPGSDDGCGTSVTSGSKASDEDKSSSGKTDQDDPASTTSGTSDRDDSGSRASAVPSVPANGQSSGSGSSTPSTGAIPNTGSTGTSNNGLAQGSSNGAAGTVDNTQIMAELDQFLQQVQSQIQAEAQAQANGQDTSATIQQLETLETTLIQLRGQLASGASASAGTSSNGALPNTGSATNNGAQNGQSTETPVAPTTGGTSNGVTGSNGSMGTSGTATPGAGTLGTQTPGTGLVPNTGAAPDNAQLIALINQLMQQMQLRMQAETQGNDPNASATLAALQDLQNCLVQAQTILSTGASSPSATATPPAGMPPATPTP